MTDKKEKTVPVNFQCDPELADQFKKVTKAKGYTQSLVLRELMKEYLAKQVDLTGQLTGAKAKPKNTEKGA